jgi:hypothetical protein
LRIGDSQKPHQCVRYAHRPWVVEDRIQFVVMLNPQQDDHLQVRSYFTPLTRDSEPNTLDPGHQGQSSKLVFVNEVDFRVPEIKRIALFSWMSSLLVCTLFSLMHNIRQLDQTKANKVVQRVYVSEPRFVSTSFRIELDVV